MAVTAARVDIVIPDNATFEDAFQFGTAGDTSWSFTGQNFRMDVKASRDDPTFLLTITSGGGEIVVDDAVNRILHFNVPESVIQANLPVAEYQYDLVMFDTSVPPVRVVLMQGEIRITHGITGG